MLRLCLAVALLLVATATPGQGLDALPASSSAQLRNLFLHQVGQLQVAMPGGTVCGNCLLSGAGRNSFAVRGGGTVQQMEHTARARGVPANVVQRLRAIVFANKVHFQLFQFRISTRVRLGHYETYIGAARRVNANQVEFGVIKTWAHGPLVPKSTPVRRRSCKRRFFVKRCRSWTEHVPRGNTAQELQLVEQALRHHAAIAARERTISSF